MKVFQGPLFGTLRSSENTAFFDGLIFVVLMTGIEIRQIPSPRIGSALLEETFTKNFGDFYEKMHTIVRQCRESSDGLRIKLSELDSTIKTKRCLGALRALTSSWRPLDYVGSTQGQARHFGSF